MPDPTPTPAPAPAPKTTPKRGIVNQSLLDELSGAEEIAAAAKKPAYAATLAVGGIDAAKVTGLTTAIAAARNLGAQAVQGTTGKQGVTAEESGLMDDLVNKIQEVQKRARQKYDATGPVKLKDYGVGQQFYNSRSLLEQTAANILSKLATDALPGITPAKITALQTALVDYQGVQGDQTGAQGDATTARRQLETAVNDIIARRREIQFAADAEWPHTDSANAGVRLEFQLPSDRVMK
ncbi:MAG: hypothetical protein PHY43_09245 [Verrucomicrobiales bacterium]|nr:hypothetical protein [Verrucomicrobiales bacterium]